MVYALDIRYPQQGILDILDIRYIGYIRYLKHSFLVVSFPDCDMIDIPNVR